MTVHKKILLGCVVFFGVYLLAVITCQLMDKRSIYSADHEALLGACRVMISNRVAYKSEGQYQDIEGDVWVDIEGKQQLSGGAFPEVIRQLKPVRILITKDWTMITIRRFPRACVIGFSAEAKGRGTENIVDGLWYYDGHLCE